MVGKSKQLFVAWQIFYLQESTNVACGTSRAYTQVLKQLPSKGFIFRA